MLEVAIISTKCALRDEFPEFMEFFEAKSWEPKTEETNYTEENNTAPESAEAVVEEETAKESSDTEGNNGKDAKAE